jgi:hypothetical protein
MTSLRRLREKMSATSTLLPKQTRDVQSASVNLVVTSTAKHDQIIRRVRTPLCMCDQVMQFQYARIGSAPPVHVPPTPWISAGILVAQVDFVLHVYRYVPVVRLCNTILRQEDILSDPQVRTPRRASSNCESLLRPQLPCSAAELTLFA